VLIPLLINIVVFTAGLYSLGWAFDYVMDRLLPDWLDWMMYILWPLFAIVCLVVVFYGFSVLANLVAGPFNGLLAAAVERHLTGRRDDQALTWRVILAETVRAVRAELKKLMYFALWAIPCLILFVIPGVNLLAAPVWFLFGGWMLAIEYLDCPLGNHGQPFPQVKTVLQTRRKLALGFGCTVMALTMIPILNFVAMPVGVAGATALYVDQLAPADDA
jgi:CysZ protein